MTVDVDPGPLVANYQTVKTLQRLVMAAPRDISTMRMATIQAIRDCAWKHFLDPHTGAEYGHETLRRFVESPMPEGLGTTVATMREFLGTDTPERKAFEDELAKGEPLDSHGGERNGAGRPRGNGAAERLVGGDPTNQVDHINLISASEQGGTSIPYLIRRLRRDAPDVAEALSRGEYPSVRAAAVAAGIVRVPTPLDLLRRAWKKATEEERQVFLEEAARETVEIDS